MKSRPVLLVFIVLIALGGVVWGSFTLASNLQIEPLRPPAIILFIGDGMGEAQIAAARWYAVGQQGQLVMDQLPNSGWVETASFVSPVTDSAAGATAMATGTRTYNDYLGIDRKKQVLETILEQAQAKGLAVGLVTTTNLSHATPAAFVAHLDSRNQYEEIAVQMLAHQPNIILGGGEDDFLPAAETGCYPGYGTRTDERNLIAEAVDAGYTYVCTAPDLLAVDPEHSSHLIGLFSDKGMTDPYEPSLAQMTETAIEILSQDPDGFFLLVEGGQIDWAAHDNIAADVITDVLGLDEAIAVAIEYIERAESSLLIVTADHETGGMSASLESSGDWDEDGPFAMPDGTPFYVNWRIDDHTAAAVPILSVGEFSDQLTGDIKNTTIYEVIYQFLDHNSSKPKK